MSRGEDTEVSRTIQTCRFLTVSILTIRGYVSYKNSNLQGGNNQTDTYTPARVIQLNGRILRMLSSGEKNKFFPAQEVGFLSNASQPAGQRVGLGGDGMPQEMGRSRISCLELQAGAHLCSPPPSQSTVPGTSPVLSQHVLSELKVRHHFAAELYLMQPLEKKEKSKVHQFFTLLFFWFMRWFFILLKSDSIF